MKLLCIKDGQPQKYSVRQLKADNPNVSFPDVIPPERLADWNCYEYTEAATQSIDPETEYVSGGQFQNINGAWIYTKTVNQYTSEELAQRLAAKRSDAELTRFDFANAVAAAGYVTFTEAAQWAAGNSIPAAVQTVLDALPAEQHGPAMVDVLARPIIRRTGNLMPAIAAAFNTDDAGLDALFGI